MIVSLEKCADCSRSSEKQKLLPAQEKKWLSKQEESGGEGRTPELEEGPEQAQRERASSLGGTLTSSLPASSLRWTPAG